MKESFDCDCGICSICNGQRRPGEAHKESSASPAGYAMPTEEEVLKAVYESGLHQYAPKGVLTTKWKDGIDINEPSIYLMNFVRKLLD